MSILFINGSPNKNGNTAALAEVLLSGKEHETLNLTDYRIGSYGQKFPDDQLNIVIEKIKQSEVVVIGSPLYWHNICGSVRNMLDRSLITVVALLSQGLTDTSFVHHLENAKANGITKGEIAEIITHAAFYAEWPKAWAAFRLAKLSGSCV